MTADGDPPRDPPRVELRVRDLTPPGVSDRQETVYEQLERLEDRGRVAEVTVEVWGKQVRAEPDTLPAADDAGTCTVRSTYEEFEAWAERTGNDLEPAFSVHTLGSMVADERERAIRFPVMCLAVYDVDDLVAVAPRSTDEGVHTVDDCLDALRSGEWSPTARRASG